VRTYGRQEVEDVRSPASIHALIVLCLALAFLVSGLAAAGELGPAIQGLVNQLVQEQHGADAALGREFAQAAATLVTTRLTAVGTEAGTEIAGANQQIGELIQARFSESQPAWNAGRNQKLAADTLSIIESVKGQLRSLDQQTRAWIMDSEHGRPTTTSDRISG
jgi:hypothetical protein